MLHLLDTKTRKEKPVPSLPKGIISGVRWHRNSRDVGFNLSSARSTSDVYSLDTQTGKVERWTYSETGGINTADFAEPQLIHWKSFDDKSIGGFLYRPPAKFAGKRPVIIQIHGGPEGQFRPGFLARNNYYLNELGIAMIFPNVRGSTGYGKSYLAADNGFLREGSYKDINSLLDWIQTQPDLDSSKVLVTGGSYGGFMTLAVATNYNDRICCSVDIVGPSNLVTFLQNTSGYRQDLRRVEYGDERDQKMHDFLEQIAPANKAKNITKPLFVIAGKNDPRVPASESQQMVDVVRKNGTPVWWLLAKDEGHGYRKKKNQDYQFYATVMFVKQYLHWSVVVGLWSLVKIALVALQNRSEECETRPATNDYNPSMIDENVFRKNADAALESLEQSLILAEETADFEVEDQSGALHVSFDDGSKFVISPNAPVRQIWISALATSFKLDWVNSDEDFVLAKTGEGLKPLVARLINQQLGEELVKL